MLRCWCQSAVLHSLSWPGCTTDSLQCCKASADQAVQQTVSSVAQPQLTRLYNSQQCCTVSADQAVPQTFSSVAQHQLTRPYHRQSAVLHSLSWPGCNTDSQQCCKASADQAVPQSAVLHSLSWPGCTTESGVLHSINWPGRTTDSQLCCTASADQAVPQTTIQHIERNSSTDEEKLRISHAVYCTPVEAWSYLLSYNNEVDNAWPHCAVSTQGKLTINLNQDTLSYMN